MQAKHYAKSPRVSPLGREIVHYVSQRAACALTELFEKFGEKPSTPGAQDPAFKRFRHRMYTLLEQGFLSRTNGHQHNCKYVLGAVPLPALVLPKPAEKIVRSARSTAITPVSKLVPAPAKVVRSIQTSAVKPVSKPVPVTPICIVPPRQYNVMGSIYTPEKSTVMRPGALDYKRYQSVGNRC